MKINKNWWKEAVAYQVYPRSFYDTKGDGIGDIRGVIEKLDYLDNLGIDLIWLSPVYESPNDDNGYDISDYKDVMSDFGTMEDLDLLIKEVHKRDMKLIMDLVINHTSDEHEWFIESRSTKDNPYRDYYIWQPAGPNGAEPNNWESIFGGSAWEWDEKTEEYYLHVFSKKQPDLNWENPAVRQDLYSMVNWWLDKGIDGFRVDAISHIKKKAGFPDLPNPKNKKYVESFPYHMNQEGIEEYLLELVENTFDQYDIVTVGEANGVNIEDAEEWVGEEAGYFDMIFQFDHLSLWETSDHFDFLTYKKIMTDWQNQLDGVGWNALFIENHDLVRAVSHLGDDQKLRKVSAKALGMMYFFMQGTPFIYQGQEIGMTNVKYESIDEYDDVGAVNRARLMIEEGKSEEEAMEYLWDQSRDNTRTPMQWDSSAEAGFTKGKPWIKVNDNYPEINVEKSLADSDSIYYFYKEMIEIRQASDNLIYGSYEIIMEKHPSIYAYLRHSEEEQHLIVVNLVGKEEEIDLSNYSYEELLLTNYDVSDPSAKVFNLRPYEARLYKIKK